MKWANCPDAESSWEPVAGLRAEWAIQAFREADEKRRWEKRVLAQQKAALVSQPAPAIMTPPPGQATAAVPRTCYNT